MRQLLSRRPHPDAKKLDEDAGHGLVATKAVFEANNTMVSQEGAEPPDGSDYYRIMATDSHNRVTAYEVTIYHVAQR